MPLDSEVLSSSHADDVIRGMITPVKTNLMFSIRSCNIFHMLTPKCELYYPVCSTLHPYKSTGGTKFIHPPLLREIRCTHSA